MKDAMLALTMSVLTLIGAQQTDCRDAAAVDLAVCALGQPTDNTPPPLPSPTPDGAIGARPQGLFDTIQGARELVAKGNQLADWGLELQTWQGRLGEFVAANPLPKRPKAYLELPATAIVQPTQTQAAQSEQGCASGACGLGRRLGRRR
jgi:hypothetical protein